MKIYIKNIAMLLILIIIVIIWITILLNPVIVSLYYKNPIWMFLYFAIIPEIVAGIIITKVLLEMV